MKRLIAALILALAGNAYGVTFDKTLTAGDHTMFKEYVTNECAMLTPVHLLNTDLERNLFKTTCEVTAMGRFMRDLIAFSSTLPGGSGEGA